MTHKFLDYPTVSINVAVYNEEQRIGSLLESIASQGYPRKLTEVLVVDGGSTDRTVEIAQEFGCRIVESPRREADTSRRLGCEVAKGDLHIYMDADMEWSNPHCLERLVLPLLDERVIGSFSRFMVDKNDPPLNRCLSYHPLQQDPLMQFLSTPISQTIFEERDSYYLCRFLPQRTPILGVVMFRTSLLHEMLASWSQGWRWSDVDFVIACAERRLNVFAYVPEAGIYHRSFLTPRIYLRKKHRDVTSSYLDTIDQRKASYVNWADRVQVLRLAAWVLYVNLLLPALLKAIIRAIKERDPALLYEAFLAIVGTDYVLFNFVVDRRGRRVIAGALSTLYRPRFKNQSDNAASIG